METEGPVGSGAALLNPDVGLVFSAGFLAGPGQELDAGITFSVATTLAGGITDAGIAQLSGGVTGTGLVTLSEQGCSPAPCTPTSWTQFTFNSSGGSILSAETVFPGATSGTFSKDLTVLGGTNGIAANSEFGDSFSSSTPEPGTSIMIGAGLCCLGLVNGKRRRRKI